MIRLPALALAMGILMSVPAAAEPPPLPGYDRFDLTTAHRARPVAASLWYPAGGPAYATRVGAGPVFRGVAARMGPVPAPGRHPVVLLSHGSGGNADGLGWLAAALALRGAIVVAVDHPGSTSGDSSPRRSVDLAARAGDLSAALDRVLSDPAFAPFVDPGRIAVVGFSLGGATALGLAGPRFDGARQAARCAAEPGAPDCAFFLRGGVDFAAAPGFGAALRDPRVARVVAVDPGFVHAADPGSLAAADLPVTVINLGTPGKMPAVDGRALAADLPNGRHLTVAPAHHLSFLGLCTAQAPALLAAEREDPICDDPPGADRAAIHARLTQEIAVALGL